MKIKYILWMLLTLTLPVLMGCQMLKNRKPQSAGFGRYCSNCLVKNLDKNVEKLRKALQTIKPKLVSHKSTFVNICNRTKQVKETILHIIRKKDCTKVTTRELRKITEVNLSSKRIKQLKSGDFAGLTSLLILRLKQNLKELYQ